MSNVVPNTAETVTPLFERETSNYKNQIDAETNHVRKSRSCIWCNFDLKYINYVVDMKDNYAAFIMYSADFPICIPYNSHDSHKKDTNKGHILSAQWLELLPQIQCR